MRKKKLGHTGIEVSEIAFGGVEIGVPYGIGIENEADMLAERDAVNLLHEAVDKGINFFDTARLYGESEHIIGIALKGKRQHLILASKCRHLCQADGNLISATSVNEFVRNSLRESLKFLRTDYIDLYMVHYADESILRNDEVKRVFVKLKEEGLVRSIGVSVYKPEETKLAIDQGVWDAIQLPFNLLDQAHSVYFGQAHKAGIGLIVRSVLMRGLLTDRVRQFHPALAEVETYLSRYRSLLANNYSGLPQLATKFALAHDAVSSVLVGIDKQQYLLEALAAVEGRRMGSELLTDLQGMAYPDSSFLNLAEWDKKGWL